MSAKTNSRQKKSKSKQVNALVSYLKNFWWTSIILAVLSILLGIYAVSFPGMTVEFLTAFFGALMFLFGIFSIVKSFAGSKQFSSVNMISGVVLFVLSAFVIRYPEALQSFLVYIIAIILILKSFLNFRLSDGTEDSASIWLIISGIIGVVAALFLVISPMISGQIIVLLLGVYAIVFGVVSIIDLISTRRKISKAFKK